MPFFTGTFTAVVGLISFITQNSVWVSLASMADFGNDVVLFFSRFDDSRFGHQVFGYLLTLNLLLVTTPWVCATVSTEGINDATLTVQLLSAGQGKLYILVLF